MAFTAVVAIIGAGFTVVWAMACGWLVLWALRVELRRGERAIFAFLVGSGCLSLAVFGLCLVGAARGWVFGVLGALTVACAGWWGRGSWQTGSTNDGISEEGKPQHTPRWFWAIYSAFLFCYFINAWAPEISPDGSGYHLGSVARFARSGGFDWGFHSIYASLSQGMEMLFLVAFTFGRHSAAALVEWSFLAALPLLLVCYGRRFDCVRAAGFAGVVALCCPVMGVTGSSAYLDVSVATILYAVFYLLQVWDEENKANTLFLIGLLCGFSYAIKYTAGIVLPFAAGWVLWRRRARGLAVLSVGTAILMFPWILRNWIWLGNPFAPFLNRWFPNPYWTDSMEHSYLLGLMHYPAVKSWFDIFPQIIVIGGLVPGFIGPIFVLAPIGLLALRYGQGRRLLLAGAVFGLPALLNTEVRFLVPAVPFVAMAMGLAMANSPGVLPALAVFHAVISWPSVMGVYCDRNAWRIRGVPIRAALRLEPESAFIAAHIEEYVLKPAIEGAVPVGQRIFSFAGRPAAYIDRDIVVGYESTLGDRVGQLLNHHDTQGVKRLGISYLWMNNSDGPAPEMKSDPKGWGLRELAEASGSTLYEIN
jgi:hypothetical protein